MNTFELGIKGCWAYVPKVHSDNRGNFFEWFQNSLFDLDAEKRFDLAQANCSISQKGVLRGIHFTSMAPGQSKFVTVLGGKVLDVIVDLRQNSPTFKKWEFITLDSQNPLSVFIPWGVGHGFLALEDNSVFVYLCDQRYNPKNEFDLNAFDPDIGIDWPKDIEIVQSQKDKQAPFLNTIAKFLPQ